MDCVGRVPPGHDVAHLRLEWIAWVRVRHPGLKRGPTAADRHNSDSPVEACRPCFSPALVLFAPPGAQGVRECHQEILRLLAAQGDRDRIAWHWSIWIVVACHHLPPIEAL